MFGNVNVDYKPCKTVAQLQRACKYILGRNPDQIKSGAVKTRPDLYFAFDDDRDNFADEVLLTRRGPVGVEEPECVGGELPGEECVFRLVSFSVHIAWYQ